MPAPDASSLVVCAAMHAPCSGDGVNHANIARASHGSYLSDFRCFQGVFSPALPSGRLFDGDIATCLVGGQCDINMFWVVQL